MPVDNEKELLKIIAKLYKAIDLAYISYLNDGQYNYISQIVDTHNIQSIIKNSLSENDLNVFITALSDNEVEANKLIKDNFSLDNFFKEIKKSNTRPIVRGIIDAYTEIKDAKRNEENIARKRKESRELYRAARLTPRQKEVLTTLGLPIYDYEKKS